MTPAERNYSALLLLWSRTLPEHQLSWEEWLVKRYRTQVRERSVREKVAA